jgi:hypothetical protein
VNEDPLGDLVVLQMLGALSAKRRLIERLLRVRRDMGVDGLTQKPVGYSDDRGLPDPFELDCVDTGWWARGG